MGLPSSSCSASSITSKQQALVLLLTRQLADAQFSRGDQRASERLWQEAAALEIDPERLIALLYSGVDPDNREALRQQDDAWLNAQPRPQRRGWTLRSLHLGKPRLRKPSLSPA